MKAGELIQDKDYLHRQLIKLGDMMGDGLHHEADGKWIQREYRAIAKQLFPEHYAGQSKRKNDAVNAAMIKFLAEHKCGCGGELKQVRSGSVVNQCQVCKKKYKAVKQK